MKTRLVVCAALFAAAAGVSVAHAQGADVAAQIKLIETQPANMDKATWKDKRRDAARKLVQSKDKRATAVLIKLAETETFDIIGEIAIEGLGNLGDSAAAPTLQKISADPARDKVQRELARKALAKLGDAAPAPSAGGASATGTAGTMPPPTADAGTSAPAGGGSGDTKPDTGGVGSAVLGDERTDGELPALPVFADDALAAYERITFAGGTASFGYDTVRKRLAFDTDVAGQYQRRVERQAMAWGVEVGAHVVAGYINPDGPGLSRGLQVDLDATGEARFYSGRLYGIGRGAVATQTNYVSDVDANNPDNTLKNTRLTADLQAAVGGGYGRVLDVGAAIRVRRLSRTLDAARALGRPIDAATAHRLQLTWWALRGERSTYRALIATVAILREAGVLLGEPDASTSYEILNVLRDSQLYLRPSGFDVQLLIGEGYLHRPDEPPANERGRVEQLLASAAYGAQLDDDKLEITGGAYGRLRLLAPDDQPSPWAAGASARLRRFTYGDHGDPFGVLDLSGEIRVSDDDLMGSELGQRIAGQLGFTWLVNAASGIRLAASVGEDRGALFIGAELQATYGLLDATFAR